MKKEIKNQKKPSETKKEAMKNQVKREKTVRIVKETK